MLWRGPCLMFERWRFRCRRRCAPRRLGPPASAARPGTHQFVVKPFRRIGDPARPILTDKRSYKLPGLVLFCKVFDQICVNRLSIAVDPKAKENADVDLLTHSIPPVKSNASFHELVSSSTSACIISSYPSSMMSSDDSVTMPIK